jgi:hypothetical protein
MVYFVFYTYIHIYVYIVYAICKSRKVRMDTTRRGEQVVEDERFLYM